MTLVRSLSCAIVLASMTGGCLSVLPEPEGADALLRIDAQSPKPISQHITIREPEARRIAAGPALVSEDETGAVRLLPGREWVGPATRQMQLALVGTFQVSEDGMAVLPETGISTGLDISTRLDEFQLKAGRAVCRATVTIVRNLDRGVYAVETVEERVDNAEGSNADRAQDMKQVAEQCVSAIASFVSGALRD